VVENRKHKGLSPVSFDKRVVLVRLSSGHPRWARGEFDLYFVMPVIPQAETVLFLKLIALFAYHYH
jgi:hypothetical protein